MKFVKSQKRKDFGQICVTRVTHKIRKFAGQQQKRGLNALFSVSSVSHKQRGTGLGHVGTAGQGQNSEVRIPKAESEIESVDRRPLTSASGLLTAHCVLLTAQPYFQYDLSTVITYPGSRGLGRERCRF